MKGDKFALSPNDKIGSCIKEYGTPDRIIKPVIMSKTPRPRFYPA